ncbi:MAG: hypothetical protein ABFC28_05930 [Rikenellaceae bacterium]
MKTIKQFALVFMTIVVLTTIMSCEKSNKQDPEPPVPSEQIIFNNNEIGSGVQEFEIKESHTIKKGVYVMKGWIYVTNGATLTIESGTVIKGDKETKAALIVEMGGKIVAQGTDDAPIVFTSNQPAGSRKPGDWGGIIICGKARNNKTEMIIEGGPRSKHGGDNDADNSGVLSYVRIEFAGYPFKTDQEINGLTMGSVGNGTKIDHVQVSYSNDDSYEWFGGTVDAKYLIAYHGWDDDFDTDNGFRGRIQFALGIRNPKIADKSNSNGFESDNNSDGTTQSPITKPVFSNMTIVGPVGQDPLFVNTTSYIDGASYNPANGSKLGQFQSALQIRRSSNLNCYNSVAFGYLVGIMICNDKGSQTQGAANAGSINLKNLILAGMTILGSDKDASFKDSLSVDATTFDKTAPESFSSGFFKKSTNGNVNYASIADIKISQPNSLIAGANWGPAAGSPLTNKSNLFTDANVADAFFDKVNFIGAFRSDASVDNWTSKWANFNPQNTSY